MEKKKKLLSFGLAFLALAAILTPIALPSAVFAATNPLQSNVFIPTILAGPITLCIGSQTANSGGSNIPTCQNLCDLVAQVAQVIYYAIAVVIWIIAPILIAVGGIMIMLGGASPEMIGRGKKTITGAIWGIVIVLCAWLIVYTFIAAFGNLSHYVGGFPGGPTACSVATAPSQNSNSACGVCGGTCNGTCASGQTCNATGAGYTCSGVAACNGTCGGTCNGTCASGQTCNATGAGYTCSGVAACNGTCGGTCNGTCASGQTCNATGAGYTCSGVAACNGTCGGNCSGSCPSGQTCNSSGIGYSCN